MQPVSKYAFVAKNKGKAFAFLLFFLMGLEELYALVQSHLSHP